MSVLHQIYIRQRPETPFEDDDVLLYGLLGKAYFFFTSDLFTNDLFTSDLDEGE
jgi:hypothetical protein